MFESKKGKLVLIVGIIALLAIGFAVWWSNFRIPPLVGFAVGNGRLEATEVDIATKFHGRVEEILFDEGVDEQEVIHVLTHMEDVVPARVRALVEPAAFVRV